MGRGRPLPNSAIRRCKLRPRAGGCDHRELTETRECLDRPSTGTPKITDFGSGQPTPRGVEGGQTAAGAADGAASYMPPEQGSAGAAD